MAGEVKQLRSLWQQEKPLFILGGLLGLLLGVISVAQIRPVRISLNFAHPLIEPATNFIPVEGWVVSNEDGHTLVQGQGPESIASFSLPSLAMGQLNLEIGLVPTRTTAASLQVWLNDTLLGKLTVQPGDSQRFQLALPSSAIRSGDNRLKFVSDDGKPAPDGPTEFLFHTILVDGYLAPHLPHLFSYPALNMALVVLLSGLIAPLWCLLLARESCSLWQIRRSQGHGLVLLGCGLGVALCAGLTVLFWLDVYPFKSLPIYPAIFGGVSLVTIYTGAWRRSPVTPSGLTLKAKDRLKNLEWVAVLLILSLGFALRLHRIEADSVWLDEALTFFVATLNLSEMLQALHTAQSVPPLHLIFMHFSLKLGQSEFFLRFPSVIFGVLCIPAVYQLGKAFFGKREGLIAAFLISISWFHVWYSQEARMYALFLLVSMLSTLFLWKALRKEDKAWFFYLVFTSLAFYTHYFSAFLLLAQGFIVVIVSLFQLLDEADDQTRRRVRRNFLAFILAPAAILLCYVPWLPAVVGGSSYAGEIAGPALDFAYAKTILQSFIGHNTISVVVVLLLFVCGLACCMARQKLEILSLLVLILFPAIAIAIFLQYVKSFFETRYVIFILGFFLIVVARGISGIGHLVGRLTRPAHLRKPVGSTLVTFIIMTSLLLIQGRELQKYYRGWRQDWRSTANFVAANERDGDAIGFYTFWSQGAFDYYYDGDLEEYGVSYEVLSDDIFGIKQRQRVWIVFAFHHQPERSEEYSMIKHYLDQNFTPVLYRQFRGDLDVVLYENLDSQDTPHKDPS